MKLGKTLAGERESVITDSERMKARRRESRRKTAAIMILTSFVLLFVVICYVILVEVLNRHQTPPAVEASQVVYVPQADIIDEATGSTNSEFITDSVRQYVGKIERDFADAGLRVVKSVIPAGKVREVDVYLDGRHEYYKCNFDRGTAETAEDAVRMIHYLDQNHITADYVDVRIERRAYYK